MHRTTSGNADQLEEELQRIFGDRFLSASASPVSPALKRYHRDMVADTRIHRQPRAVVFPRTTAEVQSLVRLAVRHSVPITPRGGGSGLVGGAVAAPGGIVCSLEQMNTVVEIDTENLCARVQPGVVTRELDTLLEPLGLFFAGYPMSEEICTIGGNVATNAGGGRAVKYGVTAAHILGLEVVTAGAEVLALGGKRIKDVTGLNLLPLFAGSEGTLGIITEITLRLTARPHHRGVLLFGFPSVEDATAAVAALRCAPGGVPASLEYIDGVTARGAAAGLRSSQEPLPHIPDSAAALLLVEAEGDTRQSCDAQLAVYRGIAAEYRCAMLTAGSADPDDPDTAHRESTALWRLRKAVPWWVKRTSGPWHSVEDVVVPPAAVASLIPAARSLAAEAELPVAIFGHAGDGNFHINPMKPPEMPEETWDERLTGFLSELYRITGELGGAISGEHGIGRKRTRWMPAAVSPAHLAAMKAVKKALDPQDIMNPGVLLP